MTYQFITFDEVFSVYNRFDLPSEANVNNQSDYNAHILARLNQHEAFIQGNYSIPWETVDTITGASWENSLVDTHWVPGGYYYMHTPKSINQIYQESTQGSSIMQTHSNLCNYDANGTEVYALYNNNSHGTLYTDSWYEVKHVLENLSHFDFLGTAFETNDTLYRYYDSHFDTHILVNDHSDINTSYGNIHYESQIN
jgi:hypothetical protein